MIKKVLILFPVMSFLLCKNGISQTFLNGDFETNTAPAGIDVLNLTNPQFNAMVTDCYSFGSFPELDLITTAVWEGGPKNGNWYVGITGGFNDQLAIELSTPLTTGDTHTISFYDKAGRENNLCQTPIEIGLSTTQSNFGTLIYTSPGIPILGEWTARVFTFVAPNNGKYITVRIQDPAPCWVNVDHFCFDTICVDDEPNSEIIMPNIFTPNGDEINDFFAPIELTNITEASMSIINRWGQTLYMTKNLIQGWDGSNSSEPCPEGTYYWLIHYTDVNNERKSAYGFFSLLR